MSKSDDFVTDEQRVSYVIRHTLSRSYPFLNLSRLLGVHYPVVLAVAKSIDDGTDGGKPWDGGSVWTWVSRVCHAPWRWQFPPQGRGL